MKTTKSNSKRELVARKAPSHESSVDAQHLGRTIACVLAGSWRPKPPSLAASVDDIERVLPLVARTHAAALFWWRLRGRTDGKISGLESLRDTYRYNAVYAEHQEARLASLVRLLRAAAIEPVLLKGWNLARRYPSTALRPYEDIDFIVRDGDASRAERVVAEGDTSGAVVDFVHEEISRFDAAEWDDMFARSDRVTFADGHVRVLSAEDHLRAVAIHGLKHSFRNPLWLCDIAVSVEAAGDDFDWARCFGTLHPQSQWIGCAIGLARELLDCNVPPRAEPYVSALPRWLIPAVFGMWIRAARHGLDERWAVREFLASPASLGSIVARRWPDPISEALRRNIPLSEKNPWQRRLHALAFMLSPKRLSAAAFRKKAVRSVP